MSESTSTVQPPVTTEQICERCLNLVCTCKVCGHCAKFAPSEDFCATCGLSTYYACCDCWTCVKCQIAYSGVDQKSCKNCNWCTKCCGCRKCAACQRMYNGDNFCANCTNCRRCCGCGIGIGFFGQPEPVFHTAGKHQHKLNPSNRPISMEIEVASVKPGKVRPVEKVIQKWQGGVVRDGSLPETGFEINTAPASGDLFIEQINEICNALKEQDGKITNACGLHVHVDAQNYDYYDIRKLVFFYAKVEEALFSLCTKERKRSEYCHPCGEKLAYDLEHHQAPKENRKKLLENIYGREVNPAAVRREKRNAARYAALNLHSMIYRGTAECRMHHGTINAETIINWGLLWAAILDFAYNNSESEIKSLTGDGIQLLCDISPSDTVKAWIKDRHEWFKTHNKE